VGWSPRSWYLMPAWTKTHTSSGSRCWRCPRARGRRARARCASASRPIRKVARRHRCGRAGRLWSRPLPPRRPGRGRGTRQRVPRSTPQIHKAVVVSVCEPQVVFQRRGPLRRVVASPLDPSINWSMRRSSGSFTYTAGLYRRYHRSGPAAAARLGGAGPNVAFLDPRWSGWGCGGAVAIPASGPDRRSCYRPRWDRAGRCSTATSTGVQVMPGMWSSEV
jgi:hypothetical protein